LGALEIAAPSLFVSERPYERIDGNATDYPCLEVAISSLYGKSTADLKFNAVLDTAASISCVPEQLAKQLMPLLYGRPALIRDALGKSKRVRTFLLMVAIAGDQSLETYRPEHGVLLTDSAHGLVGMDILKYWTVALDGVRQTFTITI
jgi:hypothetical protein